VSDIHQMGSEKEIKRKKFLDELSKKGFTIKVRGQRRGKLIPRYLVAPHSPGKAELLLPLLSSRSLPSPSEAVLRAALWCCSRVHNAPCCILTQSLRATCEETWLFALSCHPTCTAAMPGPCTVPSTRSEAYLTPGFLPRGYFGEKVALYFAWLGWYTYLLGIASVFGMLIFVIGITVLSSSQLSKEICKANTTIMCPLCDQKCPFWLLSDTCTYAKITHMIDNEGTVLFAMFMAIWATVFLELWKRQRATVVTKWDLYEWDDDEEELAMELINNPLHEPQQYQHSYFRSTIVILLVLVMIAVLIGIAHALVIYRVVAMALFTQSSLEFIREHANTVAVVTGAVLHYLTIVIMTKVNRHVALYLCDLEQPRTFSQRENNFTVKIFTFQFFTNFSSLIYIAFFLGRINGHPGNYVRVAGKWRLEECHPSGCITDLFIQMATITILKQTLSNFVEYLQQKLPKKKNLILGEEEEAEDPCKQWWLSNYQLNQVHTFSLFDEFLEMVIQYSFTTIFVAAFPLAPVLAFINNLVEIRLDAIKMVHLRRRMVPRKANDIGIWLQVLEAIGILAVIGNGLVIAITSDFIPIQVYKYTYGPCVAGNSSALDCSAGYINHSLSTFRIRDFEPHMRLPEQLPDFARYRDYRNAGDYSYTVQFWHVFAARLAFLILFEHVALCIKFIAAWYVPDVPQSVKNIILDEKHTKLQKGLRWVILEKVPGATVLTGATVSGRRKT
uniref:Anoctamin n=1 Tax=Nothoprocta perdicaria TaxID=30464 RepID=A0A8C6YLM3_NOTPE